MLNIFFSSYSGYCDYFFLLKSPFISFFEWKYTYKIEFDEIFIKYSVWQIQNK